MWCSMRRGTNRLRVLRLRLLVVGLVPCLAPTGALARPLTSFDLAVVGLELDVGPATQSLPTGGLSGDG